MSRTLHISSEEIAKQSRQLFKPVIFGESGVSICYPTCKINYNLTCFLNDKKILKNVFGNLYKRFLFIPIQMEKKDNHQIFLEKVFDSLKAKKIRINKNASFQDICEKIINMGKEPYFFILDAQILKANDLNDILHTIHSQILKLNRVGAIAFFEANIYRKEIAECLENNNKFLQNTLIFPTYSLEESQKFLYKLAQVWKIKITDKFISLIANQFRGNLWLLREVLRQVRDNNNYNLESIIESPGIQLRLETIYNSFSQEEKNALAEICYGDINNVEDFYKNYFLLIGVIEKNRNKYWLTLPLLKSFIEKNHITKQLEIHDDKISFQRKDISSIFTQQELEVILHLIKNKNSVVSREDISKVLWKDGWADKYSDWAIDKLISRIREKLSSLKIPQNTIRTKKGLGFIFS
ncbi:MAG: helix-turn-helix domain-containing protein [bacterium]|nr:helix-turn-helix domain-containing protein [bacterium]